MQRPETIDQFLTRLASKTVPPSGGGVAALNGAMGAALISMSCRLTIDRPRYAAVAPRMAEILGQAERHQQRLYQLANADAVAVAGLLRAYQQNPVARQRAYRRVCNVPLATARRCAALVPLATEVAERGNQNARGDALAGQFVAEAGLKISVINLRLNLSMVEDATFVGRRQQQLTEILRPHPELAAQLTSPAAKE